MIRVSHQTKKLNGTIQLPSSKSISNRMLVLKKMYEPGLKLNNLSTANDTQLLQQLLLSENTSLNVQDAGTAFRFLVAYCTVTEGNWTIKGTARLNERPIKELVDALRLLGAEINYLEKENYAPLKIVGTRLIAKQEILDLRFVRSSQFISALIMIAPKVEGEFKLLIDSKMRSYSYVSLTINAMERIGFQINQNQGVITVSKSKKFACETFKVEPDWTSFYYWYAMAHLSSACDLFFPGIDKTNMSKERSLLNSIGNSSLTYTDENGGLRIKKADNKSVVEFNAKYDFSQFPDLAPTFAFLLPALRCNTTVFAGLESLKFKECDREQAIGQQLAKMHVDFEKNVAEWSLNAIEYKLIKNTLFNTYHDHRMAMAAAPLALLKQIEIEDETVVNKSYPHFWDDLKSVGFEIDLL
jgi:3-phosphoshikimate 1-carboxyvinyltransferase